jgi:hypothetical protein
MNPHIRFEVPQGPLHGALDARARSIVRIQNVRNEVDVRFLAVYHCVQPATSRPNWTGSTFRKADMPALEPEPIGIERATRLLDSALGETLRGVTYGVYEFEIQEGLDRDLIELCGEVELQFGDLPGLSFTWIPLESARSGEKIGDWELGVFEQDKSSQHHYEDASNFRIWTNLLGTRLMKVEVFGLLGAPIVARFQFESGAALIGVGSNDRFCCFDSVMISADRPFAADFRGYVAQVEHVWAGVANSSR